jgi:hypothetical protein
MLNLQLKKGLFIPKHDWDISAIGNGFERFRFGDQHFYKGCLFFNALKVLTNGSEAETG